MHKHLRRLDRVWVRSPIYFVTTCTSGRRRILACEEVAAILIDEWRNAHPRHGWAIGRYVIMPDHVHFFCRAEHDAKRLFEFVGFWKSYTSRKVTAVGLVVAAGVDRGGVARTKTLAQPRSAPSATTVWQREFFDHVLRSSESYSDKWDYVKQNPVRAGLVQRADEWPWQGEIEQLML